MFIEMQIGNQLDEDDYLHFDYQSIIIMKKSKHPTPILAV